MDPRLIDQMTPRGPCFIQLFVSASNTPLRATKHGNTNFWDYVIQSIEHGKSHSQIDTAQCSVSEQATPYVNPSTTSTRGDNVVAKCKTRDGVDSGTERNDVNNRSKQNGVSNRSTQGTSDETEHNHSSSVKSTESRIPTL